MQDRVPTQLPVPEFDPVPRKYRHDGWTPERQKAFIEALAETGSVRAAAKRVNMSPEGAYYLRRQPGADSFRRAWLAALDHGVTRIEDIAMERAINGVESPVYSYGKLIGTRIIHNDRLLMFILRNRLPERFGNAERRLRPGSAIYDRVKREWEAERDELDAIRAEEARATIETRVEELRRAMEAEEAEEAARREEQDRTEAPEKQSGHDSENGGDNA